MGFWKALKNGWQALRAAPAAEAAPRLILLRDWRWVELRFKNGTAQSRMSRWAPDRLVVDYTRTMLGALLLVPAPARIAMVGLGGGSQAKFLHRHLPGARLHVFENDADVIALRRTFRIPDDDRRLTVEEADAAKALPDHPAAFDLLLVDGYDVDGIPEALSTQRFYNVCRDSLREGGVMAVNLYDTAHAEHLHRMRVAFGASNVALVDEPAQSNRVAFAWRPPIVTGAPALSPAGQRALEPTFRRLRGLLPGRDGVTG